MRLSFKSLSLALRIASRALRHQRRPRSLTERRDDFARIQLPLEQPVSVRWSEQQIPFIEAQTDKDLALTLGAVHGHLRLSQIEFMRRLAYGQMAEVLGEPAIELDRMLRTLDFPRAVPTVLNAMPPETRKWIDAFVAGLNAALGAPPNQPEEFSILEITPEPWKAEHILALTKLAAADFSWKVWHSLARLREHPEWPSMWERLMEAVLEPTPSFAGSSSEALPWQHRFTARFWDTLGRTGSNAAAVSAAKSASGGALLSADPHLSIMAPNSWLIAGMKSPGFHIVGLMIPGLPVIALGRNKHIAWSGTNLHAASSDLFNLGEGIDGARLRSREEVINVRGGNPQKVTIRESAHGPVLSDSPLLRLSKPSTLALTWAGHRPSDELNAMLGMMRAKDWSEFTAALEGYGGPALNIIFADSSGNVGRCMAAHLPRRPHVRPPDLALPPDELRYWRTIVTAADLPTSYSPPEGFVASANDRPRGELPTPVGFFFSPDERVERLRSVLNTSRSLTLVELRQLHQDVTMPSALHMAKLLCSILESALGQTRRKRDRSTIKELQHALDSWDGRHSVDSAGALAFESLLFYFLHYLHGRDALPLYLGSLRPWDLLRSDLSKLPETRLTGAVRRAAHQATRTLRRYQNWGTIHRIRLAHPFAALPILGPRRYVFSDIPAGGSNETLMKTAHGLSSTPHAVSFGANARFLSDLSNPDENYAVLLGGQDGLLGSSTFSDQLAAWQKGAYFRIPLNIDAVRVEFPHETVLTPPALREEVHT